MDAPVVISQIDALRAGQTLFYSGVQCKNGHLSPRYSMTGVCVECAREQYLRGRLKNGRPSKARTDKGIDISEPAMWTKDGGVRREPVLDHNFDPPRVVRRVGWRRCMCCRDWWFSPDVVGVRICPPCKRVTFGD